MELIKLTYLLIYLEKRLENSRKTLHGYLIKQKQLKLIGHICRQTVLQLIDLTEDWQEGSPVI